MAGTKYPWLESARRMGRDRRTLLCRVRESHGRTGRAWTLKELASRLWAYTSKGWARKAWTAWATLASRSKRPPMAKAAEVVRKHLEGILNAVVLQTTNGAAESLNAMTKQGKRMKTMARGNRNRDRLRNANLFHLGELDLYPRVSSARTDS